MNYLVTRHSALADLVVLWEINIDVHLTHLVNTDLIKRGDSVYGNLPIELVAQICAKGAHYFNFNVSIPFNLRGKELSLVDLQTYNGHFEQYEVKTIKSR